eukprot:g5594.t1
MVELEPRFVCKVSTHVIVSLAEAERLKDAGNECFRRKVYREASELYQRALNVAPMDSMSRAVYYGNKAACSMRLSEFNDALESCNKALKINKDYVKVLMRRCLAYENLKQLENAVNDAKSVLQIDPSHQTAIKTLQRLQAHSKDNMIDKFEDPESGNYHGSCSQDA